VETKHNEQHGGDMPAEEFRRGGHQVIDWIADFLAGIGEQQVFPATQPGELRAQLPAAPPSQGEPMTEILADVDRLIMPGMVHWNHPRFMAYFTSSGSGPGILGELLAAAFNINGMLWQSCPAATELEQVTLDWVRQLVGLPETFWGLMTDGGSSSNFHALAAAREHLTALNVREHGLAGRSEVPRLRVYTTEQAHSSIQRGALALGLGMDSIRLVAVDAEYRMQPAALAAALAEDRRAGWLPCCVAATLGSTSCTSLDPVNELADLCEREGAWLHVDAAYGGAAAVLPEMRGQFAGWERADSITINPHKWLFVPLDCSVLFTRRRDTLRRAFSLVPEYLRTADSAENYMDYSISLGRRFRALKLWFVLRYFGQAGLAERLREHLRLAQWFAGLVDAHPAFERLAPVPLSVVCFRAHPAGVADEAALNQLNEALLRAVNQTGDAFLTHTKLDGRFAIRMVISHLRVDESHIRRVWQIVQEQLARLGS